VVLSVFNGFEGVIDGLYNTFDPDLKVLPASGKSFELPAEKLAQLKQYNNIAGVTCVFEENALIRYGERQTVAQLKGVDNNFFKTSNIAQAITIGDTIWNHYKQFAIMGRGLSYLLGGVNLFASKSIRIIAPRPGSDPADMDIGMESLNQEEVFPTHEFAIQKEIDGRIMILPLEVANKLFSNEGHLTQLEIALKDRTDETSIMAIKTILGKDFTLQNRREQHQLLNKVMNGEKMFSYAIMMFILLVGSFNLIAMLIMLIMEKRGHIDTLKHMGGSTRFIRGIFFSHGMLVTCIGCFTGLALGFTLCWLQKQYGFITLGDAETMVIDVYPVEMRFQDFAWVTLTSIAIGFLASWYASGKAVSKG
jgi:lipoprotein-releasing system permease protein